LFVISERGYGYAVVIALLIVQSIAGGTRRVGWGQKSPRSVGAEDASKFISGFETHTFA
jgi:hypothetical protein